MQDNKTSLDNVIKRHAAIRSRRFFRRMRKYFLTGILVTAPIGLTLYLAWIFVAFMDRQLTNMLPDSWQPAYDESIFPGSGVIFSVLFLILMGWLGANYFGRLFLNVSEYIMVHVPVVNTLYNAIKQIVETLFGGQAKAFREVVLIEYPRAGCWTIGFITGVADGEIKNGINGEGEEIVNVFVPTAPSPVNGFLLFVPRKEAISMKMTVDQGIKMVVSMGMITPPVAAPVTEDKAA